MGVPTTAVRNVPFILTIGWLGWLCYSLILIPIVFFSPIKGINSIHFIFA